MIKLLERYQEVTYVNIQLFFSKHIKDCNRLCFYFIRYRGRHCGIHDITRSRIFVFCAAVLPGMVFHSCAFE
jgi:hypothetical protein